MNRSIAEAVDAKNSVEKKDTVDECVTKTRDPSFCQRRIFGIRLGFARQCRLDTTIAVSDGSEFGQIEWYFRLDRVFDAAVCYGLIKMRFIR